MRVRKQPAEPVPSAPVQPAVPAANGKKPLVNCYWSGDSVVLVHPDRTSTRVHAKFGLFVKAAECGEETLRQLKGSRAVKSITREGDWLRIDCPDLDYRTKICAWLETKQKVHTYEGDINPVRRYLLDNASTIVPPKCCYIDIETDSRVPFTRKETARILCIAVVDGTDWAHNLPALIEQADAAFEPEAPVPGMPHARRLVMLEEDTDEAEKKLLQTFWSWLVEYHQVVAWSGDRFDFPVIMARTKYHGLTIPWKRWLWLDHLELFRRMNMSAAESGEEKQSMKLNTIAMQVLGEGKDEFDSSKTWEAWEAGGVERARLGAYCSQDTILMPKIEEKTGYIALLGTLCEVTGTFPDTRGVSPQQQVEAFMLTLAKQHNYKPRTREHVHQEVTGQFEGAFVMQPKMKGIMRDVHVCDFASMYPSIILTWNMSPDTKIGKAPDPNAARPTYLPVQEYDPVKIALSKPNRAVAAGTNVMFSQATQGILPIAIAELIRLRKYWRDLKASLPPGTLEAKEAERRSSAYKIAGNSFYGVMGSVTSRFFDREVAESVTLCGKWLIGETIKEAEARGMQCVYGDTDSVFVVGSTREEFESFVKWCNTDLYPKLVRGRGCTRNAVKLEYEKQFSRLVMTTAKKYTGMYAHYKGELATADSKPEIRGLEYRRGDGAKLAREMQGEAIDMLMKRELEDPAHYHALVVKYRDHILQSEFKLVDVKISKRLSKPLRAYVTRLKKDGTASAPQPHVVIARLLQKRGQDMDEGSKVDYVCVDGSTSPKQYIPADDFSGTFDRHEMWEASVYPATQRLLEAAFPSEGWNAYEKTRPRKARRQQREHSLNLFEHAASKPKAS